MRPHVLVLAGVLLVSGAGAQQTGALLTSQASTELFRRTVQLMESTAVSVPGLVRASAPVVENARQALVTIEAAPGQSSALTYTFLANVRAYLALADSVPKPFPFPEEARRQFAELRESVDRTETYFRALLDVKESQVRSSDRDNVNRYTEANQRVGPPNPDMPRVVFLGDSITDGWRLNEYFTGRDFVNRGISGQVTSEMLCRMKADVIDLKPAAVLILAGTNDIARGVSIRTIQNNLTMIADLAEAHKIKPLFASILPVHDYNRDKNPRYEMTKARQPSVIVNMNIWIRELCRQRGYTFVDYHTPMADKAGFLQKELADDGLHPNSMGYRIMAPIALEAIGRTVGAQVQQQPAPGRKKRLGVF
jgi:lysophospholipase L1-like esterase